MSKENNDAYISQIYKHIYTVRGVKVMLDSDLAAIYGYETRAFNQQVKNNVQKFDEDFRFQLTKEEYAKVLEFKDCMENSKTMGLLPTTQNLISKNLTSNWGGNRRLPYVFTEQGVYMLMTVLKGELATKQSKMLIRAFKEMKDIIYDSRSLVGNHELIRLSLQTAQNAMDIAEIKNNMLAKSDFERLIHEFTDQHPLHEYLILNGKPVEANLAYNTIYGMAECTVYVIDNYIGTKTLVLLKNIEPEVSVTIFSDNIKYGLHQREYDDFRRQYPQINITFRKTCGIFHDRYIILDYKTPTEHIFHCGASSKDAGNKVAAITEVADRMVYHQIVDDLLDNPLLVLPSKK